MKLLIKFPTRGRPQKFLEVLQRYVDFLRGDDYHIVVSCDIDDASMQDASVLQTLSTFSHLSVHFSPNQHKIEAVNADMIPGMDFDILLLASDDMIPVAEGYDEMIRHDMTTHYPDTDGVLWYHDGVQDHINTLAILGKKYYERFGYIYHPAYKSLFADNEFMEVAASLGKQSYMNHTIIQHQHPVAGYNNWDELYARNQNYCQEDENVYTMRKSKHFYATTSEGEHPLLNVISFSLWGDDPKYNAGAIRNAERALELYPGWTCRYYVGSTTPASTLTKLRSFKHTQIIDMDEPGDHRAMFWRFLPASDPEVAIMLSRDCDSRLTERERAAVAAWLNSDKLFHIMRDHPMHNVPILGGMWGVKNPALNQMDAMINDTPKGNYWQADQEFLHGRIYPLIQNHCLVHDEFFESAPFPIERVDQEFVGESFDEHDRPNIEHRSMLAR